MCLAIPGRIVRIEPAVDPAFRVAKVDFAGITKQISLSLTPDAEVGNYVLVHVGFALTVVDEAEAQKTLAFLETIAGPDELRRELGVEDAGEPS